MMKTLTTFVINGRELTQDVISMLLEKGYKFMPEISFKDLDGSWYQKVYYNVNSGVSFFLEKNPNDKHSNLIKIELENYFIGSVDLVIEIQRFLEGKDNWEVTII